MLPIPFNSLHMARSPYRLVSFDMDSTLIQAECIDELAKDAGVGDRVVVVTEAAMRGELDFRQALQERVALLKGLTKDTLESVYNRIELHPGAAELVKTLKADGIHTAIASGGFTFFANRFAERLGIDFVLANVLETDSDLSLTGRVIGPVVDADAKAEKLKQLAEQLGLSLDQTAAIGDGANDLKVMNTAGLGIAYCAKPIVAEQAKTRVDTPGLEQALPLLGLA